MGVCACDIYLPKAPAHGPFSISDTMPAIDEDWIEITYTDIEDMSQEGRPFRKGLDPGLPRSNPTKSSWQIPPDPLQNFRSTDSLPSGILDVVIIGSGFSGTSIAWHLLHGDTSPRTSFHSALMLEAREVCSGATGRNGITHIASVGC